MASAAKRSSTEMNKVTPRFNTGHATSDGMPQASPAIIVS